MTPVVQWAFGPFRLDAASGCLWRDDELMVLSPKPVALLAYLVAQAGEVVPKATLLDAVWPETAVTEGVVKTAMGRIRQVLGESARAPQFIETIPRRGYRFIAPVTPVEPPIPIAASTALNQPHVEAPGASQTLAAERRQLTVLFCDLVDSSLLAGQLDPEDLMEVLQAYRQACAEAVERFDGYVAQYLGDGVVVYFGYPVAHEDDAQRAVWSGLGLLEALVALNARLALPLGYQLAARLGLHTGLVVVGNVGTGGRQEFLAQGETLHIAARLQSLAGPNELVISATTRHLLGGVFNLKELGMHALKGVTTPIQLYRVLGSQAAESRFEAMTVTGLMPLVGREEELGLLWRRWEQAMEGEGQVVLLSGDAGLGKSRLTQELCQRLADVPHLRVLYQCSPYHTNSAFYPLMAHLQSTLQLEQVPLTTAKLARLETLLAHAGLPVTDVAPLLASLLSIPSGDRYAPLTLSLERQKEQTMAAWADLMVGWSQREPVLFIIEDVHWSDPTTLETLAYMIHHAQDARVLIVLTFRPEFASPWGRFAHVTTHTLNRLTRRQIVVMVEHIAGRTVLPVALAEQIVAKSDGVPLFVEELTKTVLELAWPPGRGEPDVLAGPSQPLALPTTLQALLTARFDRLPEAREIAQYGAVLGREFAYEMLQAILPLDDEALQQGLTQLVQAELLHQRGCPPHAHYLFKHALVQEAAYQSLLRRTRQQVHQHIAQLLETQFPATAETQPELLAYHYTEAGLNQQAVFYWKQAGAQAVQQSANVEAIAHINKGLALLTQVPDSLERAQDELALHLDLGVALTASKGFAAPEVERAYARARALCQQLGDSPQLFPVLYGLWNFYAVRADIHSASALAEQLWALAQREDDTVLLMEAHIAYGETRCMQGDFAPARAHLEQALALYDPQQHSDLALVYGEDPGVTCSCFAALDMWTLGYPALALQRVSSMTALAREREHPFSTAQVFYFGATVYLLLRHSTVVHTWAERLMGLSREQDFLMWEAGSRILHGWALSAQGQHAKGLGQMQQGLTDWQATGAEVMYPWHLGLLVEAYRQAGHLAAALSLLDKALTEVDNRGERWCEAELHRLRGELLLSEFSDRHAAAENCFQTALDIARAQQAKSWELRAAMSLCRLWCQQGKRDDALKLLAAVYDWFSEGFDTTDLQEAKALLDELNK